MGIARTLTKNTLFQGSANMAAKLASLLLTVFLTMMLPPEQFGIYAWAIAIVVMFNVFAGFGTGNALLKFVPEALAKNMAGGAGAAFRHLLRVRAYALALVAASVLVSADLIATYAFGKPFLATPLRVAVGFLIAYNFREYLDTLFVALKENEACFFGSIVEAVLKVSLVVGLVLITSSVYGALAGCILGASGSALYLYMRVRKRHGGFLGLKGRAETARINPYLKYVVLAGFSFVILTNIDLLMISSLLPIADVGFYRIATAWAAAVIGLIPVYLAFPIFSGLSAKNHSHICDAFDSILKYIAVIAVPLAFGVSFIAAPLVALLYSAAYGMAGTLLTLLAFLIALNALAVLSAALLDASGRPDIPTKIYVGMILFNAALNYALITGMGVAGAAYATLATYVVMVSLLLTMVRSRLKVRVNAMHIAKPLVSAGIAYAIISQLPVGGELLAAVACLLLGLAIFIILELAIKGLSVSEIRYLYGRISRG